LRIQSQEFGTEYEYQIVVSGLLIYNFRAPLFFFLSSRPSIQDQLSSVVRSSYIDLLYDYLLSEISCLTISYQSPKMILCSLSVISQ
jgi:hypothetical protein